MAAQAMPVLDQENSSWSARTLATLSARAASAAAVERKIPSPRQLRPASKEYGVVNLVLWEAAGLPTSQCGHNRKWTVYSITLSALASSVAGTASPSALAVLRLIDNSNLET